MVDAPESPTSYRKLSRALPASLAHLAFAGAALLLLVAAGQPIFTDDTWWHLALGRAHAAEGAWLEHDPLLHTARAAPAPAAWLFDLSLYGVVEATGLDGLRVLHVALVAGILVLAWSLLRRASGSAAVASLCGAVFVCAVAYRAVQLRPELLTIAAVLVLYRLLIEGRSAPTPARIGGAAALMALWANLHSGFLLGPLLLAAGFAGIALGWLRSAPSRPAARARGSRLAIATSLGLVATLANPDGLAQHLSYLRAGIDTPALANVVDEWRRLDLLALPDPGLPPGPLGWALAWLLLLGSIAATWRALASGSRPDGSGASGVDPALVAMSLASLVAMISAVRFLWLAIFPLLLIVGAARGEAPAADADRRATPFAWAWARAAAAWLVLGAFVLIGDWPRISQGLPRSLADAGAYAEPYPTSKYHAHAVWFLRDSGLEGRLANEYYLGGFLGFWLAPTLSASINGTLNVPKEVLEAHRSLRERRGEPGQTFLELLDRLEIDVFVGIGVPIPPLQAGQSVYTTTHLEATPGWIPVFRNLESAVYLRDDPRNARNLERVADYYRRAGVPFDAEQGFDPRRAIAATPAFAVEHGISPVPLDRWRLETSRGNAAARRQASDALARTYALLGLYEDAIALDRAAVARDASGLRPGSAALRRRLAWSLLHVGRPEEALAVTRGGDRGTRDPLLDEIGACAARIAGGEPSDGLYATPWTLPFLSRSEAAWLASRTRPAAARGVPPLDSPQRAQGASDPETTHGARSGS